jgi:hypothetical protein
MKSRKQRSDYQRGKSEGGGGEVVEGAALAFERSESPCNLMQALVGDGVAASANNM